MFFIHFSQTKASLPVTKIQSVKAVRKGIRDIPKAFEIFTDDQTYVFKAKGHQDAEQWIQCLHIAVARSHTTTEPPSSNLGNDISHNSLVALPPANNGAPQVVRGARGRFSLRSERSFRQQTNGPLMVSASNRSSLPVTPATSSDTWLPFQEKSIATEKRGTNTKL